MTMKTLNQYSFIQLEQRALLAGDQDWSLSDDEDWSWSDDQDWSLSDDHDLSWKNYQYGSLEDDQDLTIEVLSSTMADQDWSLKGLKDWAVEAWPLTTADQDWSLEGLKDWAVEAWPLTKADIIPAALMGVTSLFAGVMVLGLYHSTFKANHPVGVPYSGGAVALQPVVNLVAENMQPAAKFVVEQVKNTFTEAIKSPFYNPQAHVKLVQEAFNAPTLSSALEAVGKVMMYDGMYLK